MRLMHAKHGRPNARPGRVRARLTTLAFVVGASVLLSGCFLRSLVGFVDINTDGGSDAHLSTNVNVSLCQLDPLSGRNDCVFSVQQSEGSSRQASSVELVNALGAIGALIDPLVLQVPVSATNLVGTYNNAGVPLPLVITETSSFPVTPSITVQAEADRKFVILELPDTVVTAIPSAGIDFDFSLDFTAVEPGPLDVKAMLTGRVDLGGVRYYLPLFPCVRDFAQVPEFRIPVATAFQDLRPQVLGAMSTGFDLSCNQVIYDFSTGVGTTSSTTTTSLAPIPATSAPTLSTTTTLAAPTTVPRPAESSSTAPSLAVLPETGTGTFLQVWVGLLMLMVGLGGVVVSRRATLGRRSR